MKLTTKEKDELAVAKRKDKEGPFVELQVETDTRGALVFFDPHGSDSTRQRVIRLVEDGERVKDPVGNLGPQKYRADDVPAADWNE